MKHPLRALDAVGVVERAATTGAQNRAAFGEYAPHLADVELFEAFLKHAIPRVVEAEHAVTTHAVGLAHDCANHGIEAWAVATAGEYTDVHYIKAKSAGASSRERPRTTTS